MRQYLILSQTTAALLQDNINAIQDTHKYVVVHGFAHDGTNFVCLISYET